MIVETPNDLFILYPTLNQDVQIQIHQYYKSYSNKIVKILNGILHKIYKNNKTGIHLGKNNYFVKNVVEQLNIEIKIYYTDVPFEILEIRI